MDTLAVIYRGQSAPIDITLQDDDGTPLNINTLDDIWVTIYHHTSKIVMETYRDSLGEITTIDAANGEIRVILNDDDTEDKQVGIYSADIKTSETDAAYKDNTRYRASSAQIFELRELEV